MAHANVVRRNMSLEQWTLRNFERYEEFVVEECFPSGPWKVREGEYHPDGYRWFGDFREIREGERWGGPDATAWFEGEVRIPRELGGKELYFQMLTPAEVIVSSGGRLLDGLDPNRMRFLLTRGAEAGECFPLVMEAYTRSKPDDDRNPRAAALRGCVQVFSPPVLVRIDHAVQSLVYDLRVIYLTAFGGHIKDDIKEYLQKKVRSILRLMPPLEADRKAWQAALPAVKGFIDEEVYGARHSFAKEGRLACVCHSHLDIAYFWRVRQTVQKNARTVLIQLNLMDRYPEFSYAHSQAWAYEMLELHYPSLFERVKRRIAEGRWEIVGAMYVEPDCNVVCAESLIRQVLLGKRFFQEKFGVDVDNCWLPDVFGNSAVLPQILRKSGVRYFVSNKMSTWNDTNRFPHNHFIWKGVDGSEVFACVPPVHFITWMDPNQAAEHWEALQDKDRVEESLQMFGYGDGGSGAADEMLEYFHRQRKLPGIPVQRLTTAAEFLRRNFRDSGDLAVWEGDLYLEMHRGTFTNKGVLKKQNRRGEAALGALEALCVSASTAGMAYPGEEIRRLWKILLLNQFHDILPGSHTAPVTRDALEDYRGLFEGVRRLKEEALSYLTEGEEGAWSVYNHGGGRRSGLAYWFGASEAPGAGLTDSSGSEVSPVAGAPGAGPVPGFPPEVPGQEFVRPDGNRVWGAAYEGAEPFTAVPLERAAPGAETQDGVNADFTRAGDFGNLTAAAADSTDSDGSAEARRLKASAEGLESPWFSVGFDGRGRIIELYDKTHRRMLNEPGTVMNEWQIFEDRPGRYSAWDISERFEDRLMDCGNWCRPTVVEEGPLSAAVRWERSFGESRAVLIIRVFRRERRVEFDCFVDWRERETLLKTAFPLDLRAPFYSCDNSAGFTVYENHRNTSWQQARFEVPCGRWVNLSEGYFGAALVNDGKYGADVRGGCIRLSLLRGSIRPDFRSDLGEHRFRYALVTHDGKGEVETLLDQARELNEPLELLRGLKALPMEPVLRVEPSDRIVSLALKQAEDGSGDIIYRGVEYSGTAAEVIIHLGFDAREVFLTDLMERPGTSPDRAGRRIRFRVGAFEIFTLRLARPARPARPER